MSINILQADSIKVKTAETLAALKDTEPNVLLQNLGQQALHFGLKVLAALAIYIIGAWLIKRITKMVAKGLEKKASDAALASFVKSLVSITLWVLLIIITVGALGINTTSLAALLAAGGMAIGMALSGTVQNFAGGIMLLVFKPIKAGDFIEAQGFTGTVSEINITSTKLITRDNRVVFIPNGALSSGNINKMRSLMPWDSCGPSSPRPWMPALPEQRIPSSPFSHSEKVLLRWSPAPG